MSTPSIAISHSRVSRYLLDPSQISICRPRIRRLLSFLTVLFVVFSFYTIWFNNHKTSPNSQLVLERCKAISTPAGPPSDFKPSSRIKKGSDRYVPGTPPTLILNAKIWTGTDNGSNVLFGDILLDKGLVLFVGPMPRHLLDKYQGRRKTSENEIVVVDAAGKWVTPGLVDLHSHIGASSAPRMTGEFPTL
jgi:hypothetical protein